MRYFITVNVISFKNGMRYVMCVISILYDFKNKYNDINYLKKLSNIFKYSNEFNGIRKF